MFAPLAIVALLTLAPPATPTRWVTDETGQLAPAARESLDRELAAFEKASGHQVLVYVGHSTGGEPIEDWAVRTFEAWKPGRARLDDGVALFVMLDDRAARIEVGYGLEAQLTDARSSRIMREVLIPRMKAQDVTGAVSGATHAIIAALGGTPAEPVPVSPPAVTAISPAKLIGMAVLAVLFVILMIVNPRAAFFLLMMFTGRRRDGSGGGGGGFSGGGGRSGGGGASGRW